MKNATLESPASRKSPVWVERRMAIVCSWLLLASSAAAAPERSIAPFTTDGCSGFPDRAKLIHEDWCDCCVAHDLAYWRGGTADERKRADVAFSECVFRATGNKALAELMFNGVRAGGSPQLNTPFRWGYGWPFGRGYQGLSPSEQASASAQEALYRARHPSLACPSK
jgi:hypothetical protein